MNTPVPHQENFEVFSTPLFDPFPEPQIYPAGWDLSEFQSPHQPTGQPDNRITG